MGTKKFCLIVLATVVPAWAQLSPGSSGSGAAMDQTVVRPPALGWSARIGVGRSDDAWSSGSSTRYQDGTVGNGLKLHSVHVLGDYYFLPESGFRASTGLIRGSLSAPWGLSNTSGEGAGLVEIQKYNIWNPGLGQQGEGDQQRLLPYVGAGYVISSPRAETRGGWRFSADLGVAVINSGPLGNLGLVLREPSSFDDLMHLLRVRPVLQLGVRYSF